MTDNGTVGTGAEPVDAYIVAEDIAWLLGLLDDNTTAYLETVWLETTKGTLVFEPTDGQIVLTHKEGEDA